MTRPKHLFRMVSFDVRMGTLRMTYNVVVWVELSGKRLGLTAYLELLSFLVIKTKSMYE